MQAAAWSPPTGTLGTLVADAHRRAAVLAKRESELAAAASGVPARPSLNAALRRAHVAVIAEVKRRSPSKGAINPGIAAATQALAYERGGAAAISVLTEPVQFGGSVADLDEVVQQVRVPVLKKDFHVHPVQLLEAKALGASAALLIVRALSPDDLTSLTRLAREIGLETIVEVRDEGEVERAISAGAQIIGINNRDLETLRIDPGSAIRLLPLIPPTIVAIAESGMRTRADVQAAADAGADAVLVGSFVSGAEDPVAAVRDLAGVPRMTRRG